MRWRHWNKWLAYCQKLENERHLFKTFLMEYLFIVGNSRRENLKEGMHRLLFTVAFLLFISISIHGSLVLLEKFLNPDAFLVMQFTCLRLVLVQQQTIVGVKIIHLRYWYEKVLADVSHLAFYVAFLVTGIWIAETHPKTVVSMRKVSSMISVF